MKNVNIGRSGGFTLIELLVVVLIIGILASVALPQYTKAVEKSRVSEMITLHRSLEKAMDVYLLASTGHNLVPDVFDSLDISLPDFNVATPFAHCHPKKRICVATTSVPNGETQVVVASYPNDNFNAPRVNYLLQSQRTPAAASWTRTYRSQAKNICKFGLEELGYTAENC